MFQTLFILILVCCTSSAFKFPFKQGEFDGTCKNLTDLTPSHVFNLDKFLGTWYYHTVYVHPEYPHYSKSDPGPCCTLNMTKESSPKGPMISTDLCSDYGPCYTEYAKIDETIFPLESAWYWLNKKNYGPISPYAPFIWLQTDNENYALVYECLYWIDVFGRSVKYEMIQLFSRQPEFDNEELLNVIDALVENHGFWTNRTMTFNNTNCQHVNTGSINPNGF